VRSDARTYWANWLWEHPRDQACKISKNYANGCNPLRYMKHFLNRNPLEDPQLVNPAPQLSANDGFFHHANRLSFKQATFNLVHGNMTVGHSGEMRSHVRGVESITAEKKLIRFKWNTYRWVDFDQQTLRQLRTSSKGIVTIEMEPMALTESRVRVHRIHCYDRQDIFENHLKFVKSPCVLLSWRTIS
jgi:hypothetical protein